MGLINEAQEVYLNVKLLIKGKLLFSVEVLKKICDNLLILWTMLILDMSLP